MSADQVEMLIAFLSLALALGSFYFVAKRTDWGGLSAS
jgi:hypothetical protein